MQVVCNNLILKYVEDDLVLRNAATFILFFKKMLILLFSHKTRSDELIWHPKWFFSYFYPTLKKFSVRIQNLWQFRNINNNKWKSSRSITCTYSTVQQCCGSRFFIHPGSNDNKKRMGKKLVAFFVGIILTKLKTIEFFDQVQKKIRVSWQRI